MQLAHPIARLKTHSGYEVTTPTADEVLVKLNNVEVLRITLGSNMTIKTQGTLTLDANNIEIKCKNWLHATALNSMDLRAGGNAVLSANCNLAVKGVTVSIDDGGGPWQPT